MRFFSLLETLWQRLQPVVDAGRFVGFDLDQPPVEWILSKFDGCIFCQ